MVVGMIYATRQDVYIIMCRGQSLFWFAEREKNLVMQLWRKGLHNKPPTTFDQLPRGISSSSCHQRWNQFCLCSHFHFHFHFSPFPPNIPIVQVESHHLHWAVHNDQVVSSQFPWSPLLGTSSITLHRHSHSHATATPNNFVASVEWALQEMRMGKFIKPQIQHETF